MRIPPRILPIVLLIFVTVASHAIQLNVQAGSDWTVTVTWSGVAGDDLTGTYESATNEALIRVRQADYPYHVDVRRSDTTWDADLHLYVKRNTAVATLVGGTTYQEVGTAAGVEFFHSTTSASTGWLDIQLQLTGVNVGIDARSFLTTVIYTVTEDP